MIVRIENPTDESQRRVL